MYVGDIGVRGGECEACVCMYVCWVYRGYEVYIYIHIYSVCVRDGEMVFILKHEDKNERISFCPVSYWFL